MKVDGVLNGNTEIFCVSVNESPFESMSTFAVGATANRVFVYGHSDADRRGSGKGRTIPTPWRCIAAIKVDPESRFNVEGISWCNHMARRMHYVAMGCSDGTLRIIGLSQNAERKELEWKVVFREKAHCGAFKVEWNQMGTALVTSGHDDGQILLWKRKGTIFRFEATAIVSGGRGRRQSTEPVQRVDVEMDPKQAVDEDADDRMADHKGPKAEYAGNGSFAAFSTGSNGDEPSKHNALGGGSWNGFGASNNNGFGASTNGKFSASSATVFGASTENTFGKSSSTGFGASSDHPFGAATSAGFGGSASHEFASSFKSGTGSASRAEHGGSGKDAFAGSAVGGGFSFGAAKSGGDKDSNGGQSSHGFGGGFGFGSRSGDDTETSNTGFSGGFNFSGGSATNNSNGNSNGSGGWSFQ